MCVYVCSFIFLNDYSYRPEWCYFSPFSLVIWIIIWIGRWSWCLISCSCVFSLRTTCTENHIDSDHCTTISNLLDTLDSLLTNPQTYIRQNEIWNLGLSFVQSHTVPFDMILNSWRLLREKNTKYFQSYYGKMEQRK